MSALLTPRRARRRGRGKPRDAGQPSLFAAAAAAAPATPAAPEPAPAPPSPRDAEPVAAPQATTTASAHRHGPTLDDLVAGAWEGLVAGAPADCLVCGTPMAPRHSAGAGVVGGRCDGCGTTIG